MPRVPYTLVELATFLNAEYRGDPAVQVVGIAPLHKAQVEQLSFLHDKKYQDALVNTKAGIVILNSKMAENFSGNALLVDNPYVAYAKVSTLFDQSPQGEVGIHSSAIIHPRAKIHPSASIGPYCVIEAEVVIEESVQIGPHCVLGERAHIGAGTRLWAQVVLYHGTQVGKRCIIHSGVVLGSDGFGIAKEDGKWTKILQLGNVMLGDDVEVGAGCTIDRGAVEDTIIEEGVKLDNQIQIAHNVRIGAHTAIAACTGIAGSTTIGEHCIIGGGSGFAGHITVAPNTAVTGMSMVTKSIHKPDIYSSGTGVLTNKEWRKNAVRFRQLDELAKRLQKLEKQLGLPDKDET